MSKASQIKKAKQIYKNIGKLDQCPLVRIQFMDHVQSLTWTATCELYGRMVYSDADVIVIIPWAVLGEDVDFIKKNCEYFSIVTSTIKEITPLQIMPNITLEELLKIQN